MNVAISIPASGWRACFCFVMLGTNVSNRSELTRRSLEKDPSCAAANEWVSILKEVGNPGAYFNTAKTAYANGRLLQGSLAPAIPPESAGYANRSLYRWPISKRLLKGKKGPRRSALAYQ